MATTPRRRKIAGSKVLEAARAEANATPIDLELYGVTYTLPPELPADVVIAFGRLAGGDPSGIIDALEGLFPREALDAMSEHRATFTELTALLSAVTEEYGVTMGELPASPSPSSDTSAS